MKRKSVKCLLILLLLIVTSFTFCANGNNDEDSWIEPDAWTRDHLSLSSLHSSIGKCCKCPEDMVQDENFEKPECEIPKVADDIASVIYLKKFVTMLFNRKHLKYVSNLQIYERPVIFTLQPSQLDKLEQLQDPRDLDNILMEIFENVRIPNTYYDGHQHYKTDVSTGFMSLMFDIFHHILQLIKLSEIRFLLIVAVTILLGCIIKNRYNIGLFTLMFGGMFLYGYLYTYLECNRELEVNQMLEVLKRNKINQEITKDFWFVKFLKDIFSSGKTEDLEEQQLKNTAKLSLGFCRPDHVIIMYFNDIFLKYLKVLLEQFTATIGSFNETLSFPYNIISAIFLVYIISHILKLTFKYILNPSAWGQFVQIKQHQPGSNSHNGDRISGENLKILLNAISAPSYRDTSSSLTVSGVQEVQEAIETSNKSDSECTAEKSQNNNSNKKSISESTDVTLEDISKES